mmetsp:Transcript_10064/g.29248  ORF Transcript_10064/g.29248 Transcript_10064/m.29248 type:complete len:323 (-) Transcript_10064:34-1002(-)
MDMDRPRRVNGLSRPYTPAQVSTWVFLPCLVVEFVFFVTPVLPLAASVPVTLVLVGLAALSAYLAYIAMKINPQDPRLDATSTEAVEEGPTKQCWICDKQVGQKSMHCKYCNKCVDHFDHHCMWLNTCVGKANYPYFFRTMLAITFLLLVHGVTQIVLLVATLTKKGSTRDRTENWFGSSGDPTIALVVVWCIFLFFDLCAFSLIVQLLAFHLRLRKEGLTTYAYIVRDNQRRREKTKLDNELAAKRGQALQRAKDEGRSCYQCQLQWGGLIRKACGTDVCDPLREPRKAEEGRGGPEVIPVATSREEGLETVREASPQKHS